MIILLRPGTPTGPLHLLHTRILCRTPKTVQMFHAQGIDEEREVFRRLRGDSACEREEGREKGTYRHVKDTLDAREV